MLTDINRKTSAPSDLGTTVLLIYWAYRSIVYRARITQLEVVLCHMKGGPLEQGYYCLQGVSVWLINVISSILACSTLKGRMFPLSNIYPCTKCNLLNPHFTIYCGKRIASCMSILKWEVLRWRRRQSFYHFKMNV